MGYKAVATGAFLRNFLVNNNVPYNTKYRSNFQYKLNITAFYHFHCFYAFSSSHPIFQYSMNMTI